VGVTFSDIALIGISPGLTSGGIHYYATFDDADRARLHGDFFHVLTQDYLWAATLRCRCSPNVKTVVVHANGIVRSEEVIWLPVAARDCTLSFDLGLTEKLETAVVVQFGFVFTNADRQRMVRVFTLSLPVTGDPAEVLRAADEEALAAAVSRQFVWQMLRTGVAGATPLMKKQLEEIAVRRGKGGALLALGHGLLSHPVAQPVFQRGGIDGRMANVIRLRSMSIANLVLYAYPRLFAADGPDGALALTGQSFGYGNCFVFHTVDQIFVWLSANVGPDYLRAAFGVDEVAALPDEVPKLGTAENERLNAIIQDCWNLSERYLVVEVIGQGSPREAVLGELLVDDSAVSGATLADWVR
jgi:protein transport protein SEC24